MRNQKGFTLIELLLVLAIIGIISAIAIPALLNQRARSRDKAAVENTVSRVSEMAAQIDMYQDQQVAVADWATALEAYWTANTGNARNPWATSVPAAAPAINCAGGGVARLGGHANKAAFDTAQRARATAANMGQGQFSFQEADPAAPQQGFCGGVVYLYIVGSGTIPGTQIFHSSVAVE